MVNMTQMISGINFIHLEDFIKRKWGTNGLDIYKEKCKLKDEKIYEEKLYPFEIYIECLQIIKDLFEDSAAPFQVGWHRAKNLLLAKGLEEYGLEIFEKIANAWPKFNNFGEVTVSKDSADQLKITITNYESHPLYCERTRGFFAGLLDNATKNGFEVKEVKCICNGSNKCEYIIEA